MVQMQKNPECGGQKLRLMEAAARGPLTSPAVGSFSKQKDLNKDPKI